MKRFIYILTLWLLTCTSCVGELGMDDGLKKKDGIVLTICNAPLTKAVDNTGEAYERELKTLDIFFYPKGQTAEPCVFYHHVDLNATFGQTEVNIYVVEDAIRKIFPTQNLCDIFVIANLPADVKPADAVYEAGSDATRLPVLESYVLDNTEANYDAINKPFVMAGLGTAQKDSKKNAEGTISLVRAASKVTLSVAIPEYLDVEITDENKVTRTVRMVHPILDTPDVNTMNAAFHNGSYKGYLFKGVDEAVEGNLTSSSKRSFEFSKTLPAVKYKNPEKADQDSIPVRRVYTCDIPFYTYAREWAKGAADAPYMTFEMKWGIDEGNGSIPSYQIYYYQILINGAGRTFQPNHWYDMHVNIGLIGSTIEIKPIVLDHLEFFVLDWSDHISGVDHPKEDVELKDYMYFNVLTKRLELDNVTTGVIRYKASHKIAWEVDNKSNKPVEDIPGLNTTEGAFYVYCGGDDPVARQFTGEYTLTDNGNGVLQFVNPVPDNLYSPVYVYLTMWLELDGVNGMGETERPYSKSVTIVQYPPIYITPYRATEFSVFVNRYNQHGSQITYNNNLYNLGQANGTGTGHYMYSVSVSGFKSSDTFTMMGTTYNYIIGDPRSRSHDEDLNNDGFNMDNSWRRDQEGNGRILTSYYPTMKDGDIFRIISPKFRVASFHGGYSSACTPEGAAMRCASYQEEGLPAGRWRLPTTAEIMFVISLQQKDLIQDIFYGANYYYSSTHQVRNNGGTVPDVRVTPTANNTQGSVRCIYDEWYWGTQPEARANNRYPGGYEFTWGDEEITW